jgi:hypothetical protein
LVRKLEIIVEVARRKSLGSIVEMGANAACAISAAHRREALSTKADEADLIGQGAMSDLSPQHAAKRTLAGG